MNLKNQIKEVKKLKASVSDWRNNFDSPEYKKASNLNRILFGMALNKRKNCDCVDDLFLMLGKYDSEKIELKQKQMESKFKLKENVMIRLHGVDVITKDNLTDEKAIELLKKYPSHETSFESLPKNWKELTIEEVVEEVVEEDIEIEELILETSPVTPKEDSIEPAEEVAVAKKAGKKKAGKKKK